MYLEELSNKIWLTKKSRFVAYRRIKRRRYGSYAFLSLFSVLIIGINLLVFIPEFQHKSTVITVLTIILSILILVVNMLITQANYQKREEDYLKCGEELDTLNEKLKIETQENSQFSKEEQIEWVNKYHNILEKYKENHTNFDYKYACILEKNKYNENSLHNIHSWLCKLYTRIVWYLIDVNTLLSICLVIIIILTCYLLSSSKYSDCCSCHNFFFISR